MAIDKSGWNKKIKVSQSTIDDIKKMGMTKALKLAGQNSKAAQGGLVKEYQEATRRLYGEKRFAAATGKSSTSAPKYTSPDAARAANKPAKYKSPDAARSAASKTPTKTAPSKTAKGTDTRPGANGTSTKFKASSVNAPRKGGISAGTVAKGIAGTAAAGAVLLATRGRGTALATKLAPKVGKALATTGGKTADRVMAAKLKTLSATGRITAKAGGAVSPAQYKAMNAAAKAKGIKAPTADAARSAATKKLAKRTAGTAAGAGATKKK